MPFIKEYFTRHAFQSMDTASFVAYLRRELLDQHPGLETQLHLDAWINGPGIPAGAPPVASARFGAVDEARRQWLAGTPAAELPTADWSSHEWVYFLQGLLSQPGAEQLTELDQAFGFTSFRQLGNPGRVVSAGAGRRLRAGRRGAASVFSARGAAQVSGAALQGPTGHARRHRAGPPPLTPRPGPTTTP